MPLSRFVVSFLVLSLGACLNAVPIDREALVSRHNPVLRQPEPRSPLSVGNGTFAFTVDVTGLQTLQALHSKEGFPLETLARWAWHENANPANYTLADASSVLDTHGRPVPYPTREKSPAGQWLRQNPHDMPLGQLGFADARGLPLEAGELSEIEQRLDLWRGEIVSRFRWKGVAVEVSTLALPSRDGVSVRVRSRALADGALMLKLAFPRGHDLSVKNTPPLDWSAPESHVSRLQPGAPGAAVIERSRESFRYVVELSFSPAAGLSPGAAPHEFVLRAASGSDELTLTEAFSEKGQGIPPDWASARAAASAFWSGYWRSGAAVDFSGSSDPRAGELERRVVLSQYLLALQCGGPVPPQETGLTCSSWYGKHNTEMVWWHVAHFSLWGRDAYVERALEWFRSVLPRARQTAAERGLLGARWSKMVGPDGRESPGGTSLIYWNQPHPIYLAELLYRAKPSPSVLQEWNAVVFETADCLASMLFWDEAGKRYVLGPPMWIAQELYDQKKSQNPTYELAYWAYALELAQEWRVRQGLPRSKVWDERLAGLSKLPLKDGRYVALESMPDTWDNIESRRDHPSFLMALGQLPGHGIDREAMRRTLLSTVTGWQWAQKIWGWDYPMIAMTAARLGETKLAVDILLKEGPNNLYLANGHCPQRKDLGVYIPANGALLAAVALMAGGWDGSTGDAPGFPSDGTWTVRAEGFRRAP